MRFRPPKQPLAFSYVDHLTQRVDQEVELTKGERRKTKLLLAAAEILQDGGYHNMRIADVLKKARVARGTFYIYFKDKSDISVQVLTDFRATLLNPALVDLKGQDWRSRIYLTNLYFAEVHQLNVGLLRAFYQFVDEADDFRKMRHAKEREWIERMFHANERIFGRVTDPATKEQTLRRLHALRVMIEGLCMQVYIEAMPDMVDLFPTPHDVAEAATNLWVDALTNSMPTLDQAI